MLQRLAQFRVAFLSSLNKPHILDGDHRLVGEGFDEPDLLITERPYFSPPGRDHSDQFVFPKHRHR